MGASSFRLGNRTVELLVALVALCSRGSLSAQAQTGPTPESGIVFPADAGVHNVKAEFGLKGDGVTDDTAGIQAAFQKYTNRDHMVHLYFSEGTYLVSKPVWFAKWIIVQGQSRAKTIFRLKDNSPDFQNPAKPRAVVGTTEPTPSEGARNMEFSAHFINFTVETGKGNSGANGIEFLSHNGGGLENVTIHSGDGRGVLGVDMTRNGPGPALCRNLQVEGFDYGISIGNGVYFSPFENLTLIGQRKAGFLNRDHAVAIRGLVSRNRVPAVQITDPDGQVVLLDARLTGGSAESCAIQSQGNLYLRDVRTEGYRAAVEQAGKTVPGNRLTEYSSQPFEALFSGNSSSLKLPVRETPPMPWEPLSQWVSVRRFASKAQGEDWSPAIQAAIDSGATTVYFPHGKYLVKRPILVRGNVRVVQGLGSMVEATEDFVGETVWKIAPGKAKTVFLDRLSFSNGAKKAVAVTHASPSELVILHSRWMSFRNTAACGDLFVDDMCGDPWRFDYPQRVWCRQLNCENGKQTKIFNRAADLWILGLKTENGTTNLHNTGPQARSEALGGNIYPMNRWELPALVNDGGQMSVVCSLFWANSLMMLETQQGVTKRLERKPGYRFFAYASLRKR